MSERMLEFDPSLIDEEQDISTDEGPQMCGICWNTNHLGEYVQKRAYPTVLTEDNGHALVTDPDDLKTLSPEEIMSWECEDCYASTQSSSTYTGKTTHPLANLGVDAGLNSTVWKQMVGNHTKKRVSSDPEEQAWNDLVEISFT